MFTPNGPQLEALKALLSLPEEQFAELIAGLDLQVGALALKASEWNLRYKAPTEQQANAGGDEESEPADFTDQLDRTVEALESLFDADEAAAREVLKAWVDALGSKVGGLAQARKSDRYSHAGDQAAVWLGLV